MYGFVADLFAGHFTAGDALVPSRIKVLGGPFDLEIDVEGLEASFKRMPVVLRGPHQSINAALVLAIVAVLRQQNRTISDDNVQAGLLSVDWPARVEIVARNPTVIIDAAHNWESAKALVTSIGEETSRKRILVFAATKDKDVAGILRQLLPHFDTVILTRYRDNPRGVGLDELSGLVEAITTRPFHMVADPIQAWNRAQSFATSEDLICVTGSFFLVAELRETILAAHR